MTALLFSRDEFRKGVQFPVPGTSTQNQVLLNPDKASAVVMLMFTSLVNQLFAGSGVELSTENGFSLSRTQLMLLAVNQSALSYSVMFVVAFATFVSRVKRRMNGERLPNWAEVLIGDSPNVLFADRLIRFFSLKATYNFTSWPNFFNHSSYRHNFNWIGRPNGN